MSPSRLCMLLPLAIPVAVCAGVASDWKPNLPDREQFPLGSYVYEQNCLVCHGARGDGRGELALTLQPKPRSLRSGVFKYRSTPSGKLPTDDDLIRVIRGGLAGTAMGMFGERLNESELRAVAQYVKSFSRKWRDPANYAPPLETPEPPSWWSETPSRGTHVAAGAKTFQSVCLACHGERADGHGPAADSLKDEWGEPITPANLLAPTLHSGNEPRDLYRVLTTGIGGTPMVSFAETLTPDQRWELVAYLESLRSNSNL